MVGSDESLNNMNNIFEGSSPLKFFNASKADQKQILSDDYVCLWQKLNKDDSADLEDPNEKYRTPLIDPVSNYINGKFKIKYKGISTNWISVEEFNAEHVHSELSTLSEDLIQIDVTNTNTYIVEVIKEVDEEEVIE